MQQYKIYALGSSGRQLFPSAYELGEIVVYLTSFGHIFHTVALIPSPYLYTMSLILPVIVPVIEPVSCHVGSTSSSELIAEQVIRLIDPVSMD